MVGLRLGSPAAVAKIAVAVSRWKRGLQSCSTFMRRIATAMHMGYQEESVVPGKYLIFLVPQDR
jgi:hypothetical protein